MEAMTDREKLYELIDGFDALSTPTDGFRHHLADYLIANGVVVREKGEWERKRVAFHIGCTACGCYVRSLAALVFLDAGELNFCPNCGSDMRGEQ